MAVTLDQNLGTLSEAAAAQTTIVLTTPAAVASGARIIVTVSWWVDVTLSTVVNSGTDLGWLIDAGNDGTNPHIAICSADAPSGLASSTTITATFSSGADARCIAASSWAGLAMGASGYLAGTSPASVTDFGGSTWTTPNVTTSEASFVFGMVANDGITPLNNASMTTGTELHDFHNATTTATHVSAYIEQASSGTYNLAGNWSAACDAHSKVVAAYKLLTGIPAKAGTGVVGP